MDKKQWRKIYRKKRAELSSAQRIAEEKDALLRLSLHPRFQQAAQIFLYASYGAEFPTEGIAALAKSHGKQVAYPKVEGERMVFYAGGKLAEGFKGIPEPQGGRAVIPSEEDLMILPGLAFTKAGARLGYGGGYYDRYLAACAIRPYLMGLSFACQLAESLPMEHFDIHLDEIL